MNATKIEYWLRSLGFFLGLVWREYEPRSCGIPEPYRMLGRWSIGDAWRLARYVWR